MPLSDKEQEILLEIEKNLKGSDPDLVDAVSSTNVYNYSGKKIWFWVSLSALSVIMLFVAFVVYYLLAVIPFISLIFCLYKVVFYLTNVGKASVEDARIYVQTKKDTAKKWKRK